MWNGYQGEKPRDHPDGEIYVADSQLNAVLHIDLERLSVSTHIDKQSLAGGWIGLASAADGKSLYIGSAPASGEGLVTTVSVPPAVPTVKEVWKGGRELGVFVAPVLGERTRLRRSRPCTH